MRLFYAPGACSIGIHVVLEEVGVPYELHKLDLRAGDQFKPPMSELNPKSKVPTLVRDDGRVVTEYPVVAHWLAAAHPAAGLWPTDAEAALRAAETMDYCVATIHMQGFSRQFRPSNFAPNEADHAAVKARGQEIIDKGFGIMAGLLAGQDWIAGSYSVADSALFYVEWWGAKRLGMTLPPACAAHLDRMLARPAVQRVLEQEGFA